MNGAKTITGKLATISPDFRFTDVRGNNDTFVVDNVGLVGFGIWHNCFKLIRRLIKHE